MSYIERLIKQRGRISRGEEAVPDFGNGVIHPGLEIDLHRHFKWQEGDGSSGKVAAKVRNRDQRAK